MTKLKSPDSVIGVWVSITRYESFSFHAIAVPSSISQPQSFLDLIHVGFGKLWLSSCSLISRRKEVIVMRTDFAKNIIRASIFTIILLVSSNAMPGSTAEAQGRHWGGLLFDRSHAGKVEPALGHSGRRLE